ncbi:polyprenyl synthetase family protein [Nocardioides sp. CER19]|uniref:polyprenyl synthetase family protein n=1 Tax=Nocardioides sp. CER19 TaxID=3038538 RepID=UPI00244C0DFA|nr:polyprenyl synthetase family protein [Nocardioides sp. CER19]MDH2414480.1 polyprenyl synthetase family protein [Nocardioides sp. CER19]
MTVTVESLGRYRELFEPGLRAAVDRLDPLTRRVVAYHLGWCDPEGRPVDANPGKAVRPTLALLVAEALTGAPAAAAPGAVAVELVHNFSLVHDDLMDRDAERRHRPTVWALWGDSTAVLAGDAMLSLAHEVLTESESPYAGAAGRALAAATRELIRGQVEDLAFEARDDVTLAECEAMAAGKTGALLGVSAAIGAILAGAGPSTVEAFDTFGRDVGLAFQLVDDLLGIWGAPERTGKPVHSDLAARKKTLPVAWSLTRGGRAGEDLRDWFATAVEPGEASLREAADLVEAAGGRAWAQRCAQERVRRALAALEPLDLPAENHQTLADLARFVTERTT